MKKRVFPPGWDAKKVKALAEYYDNQNDEEAIAEAEAALETKGQTLVMVPTELMPTIRALIAKHDYDRLEAILADGADLPGDALTTQILDKLSVFTAGTALADDLTLLVVDRRG